MVSDFPTFVVVLVVASAAIGAGFAARWLWLRRVRESIHGAAKRLGLRCPAGNLGYLSAEGAIHGRRVVVAFFDRGNRSGTTTRIVVETPYGHDLTMARETIGRRLGKMILGQDLSTGDDAFDAVVLVRCRSETVARMLLTSDTRAEISSLLTRVPGAVIEPTGISLDVRGRPKSAAWLCDIVEQFVRAGDRLALGADTSHGISLARNAQTDPVPGVRIRCLTTLVNRHPSEAAAALAAAAADPDAAVRTAAARLSGALDGAEPGRISLAEPAGGELSSTDASGALSAATAAKKRDPG